MEGLKAYRAAFSSPEPQSSHTEAGSFMGRLECVPEKEKIA